MKKFTIEEDVNLALKCSKGCERSKDIFYRRFYKSIYNICIKYSKNKMESEDLTHDCFVKLLDKIGEYRGSGPLQGWVNRSAVNLSITMYHRRRNEFLHVDSDTVYYLEDNSLKKISSEFIWEDIKVELDKLPDGYRKVIKMYAIDGYSHKEISSILGISEGTSKSQFSRGRNELKKRIEKIGYDQNGK